jgi:hypothetical protein
VLWIFFYLSMLENLRAHGVGLLLGVVFLVVAYKASEVQMVLELLVCSRLSHNTAGNFPNKNEILNIKGPSRPTSVGPPKLLSSGSCSCV